MFWGKEEQEGFLLLILIYLASRNGILVFQCRIPVFAQIYGLRVTRYWYLSAVWDMMDVWWSRILARKGVGNSAKETIGGESVIFRPIGWKCWKYMWLYVAALEKGSHFSCCNNFQLCGGSCHKDAAWKFENLCHPIIVVVLSLDMTELQRCMYENQQTL